MGAVGRLSVERLGLGLQLLCALVASACGGTKKSAKALPPPEYEAVSLPAYQAPKAADPLDALMSVPDSPARESDPPTQPEPEVAPGLEVAPDAASAPATPPPVDESHGATLPSK
jgi:hypothetical protein